MPLAPAHVPLSRLSAVRFTGLAIALLQDLPLPRSLLESRSLLRVWAFRPSLRCLCARSRLFGRLFAGRLLERCRSGRLFWRLRDRRLLIGPPGRRDGCLHGVCLGCGAGAFGALHRLQGVSHADKLPSTHRTCQRQACLAPLEHGRSWFLYIGGLSQRARPGKARANRRASKARYPNARSRNT